QDSESARNPERKESRRRYREPENVARSALSLDALDLRAEVAQFFVEMFVTAVDVINATYFGHAFGFQTRQHQRRARAQIARHHWRAVKLIDAFDHRGRSFKIDIRAHAFQFRHVHVALRENIFRDHADAVGRGKERT